MKRTQYIASVTIVIILLFSSFTFAQDTTNCDSTMDQMDVMIITSNDYVSDVDEAFRNVQQNTSGTPENAIKDITALLFKIKITEIANLDKQFEDFSIFWDKNSHNKSNLEYFLEDIKLKKLSLIALNKRFSDIKITLSFEEMAITDSNAKLEVYEWFEYYDSKTPLANDNTPSGIGINYIVEYVRDDSNWLITNIVFYDESTSILKNHELNAEELAQIRADCLDIDTIDETEMSTRGEEVINSEGYTTYINTSKVKNYAQQYSSNTSGYSSYNSNFTWYSNNDCQNFASQSIWYGLGGTNSTVNINNKYWPMVPSGTYSWYGTGSTTNGRWSVCGDFGSLIANTSANRAGPHGSIYSGISKARVGDIIQFKENSSSGWKHSYVVVAVTGTYGSRTASDITVCAHTTNRKNNLLSNCYVNSYIYRTIHVTFDWRATDPHPIV